MNAVAQVDEAQVDVRAEAAELPLDTKFILGSEITPIQKAFLDIHGFIHFSGAASRDEVARINGEVDRIQSEWLAEERKEVFGIPIFTGRGPDGGDLMQRIPFTSVFSDAISQFLRQAKFEPIRTLVGGGARIGDKEKDGAVVSTYVNVPGSVYPRLGWHTDGLRSIAYLRMPGPMLNVGMHLTDCPRENGGLRLIPGTHRQGFLSMCFHKPYFVWHRPDKREVAVETRAGDLTVHDGRLWHRVERSPHTGRASLRRVMYVPYLTDEFHPKGEDSSTPIYHHIGKVMRLFKRRK